MGQPGAPAPLVALLTDFGLTDPYVGQMKAVLATAAPGIPVLDLCHGIAPHDVRQAAFYLAASLPWLPPGSVVAVVVDPGVGTERRLVALTRGSHSLLAPDNGILTLVLAGTEPLRAFDATPAMPSACATFHGRDIIAPLAARLAMGETGEDLGPEVALSGLERLGGLVARRQGRRVMACVLSVDRFGNVVTSCDIVTYGRLPRHPALVEPRPLPLVAATTYAAIPPGAIGLLAGSQGYLELAAPCASAAVALGLAAGDRIVLDVSEDIAPWV
jgi:S-adenosylmethionine hydrolase